MLEEQITTKQVRELEDIDFYVDLRPLTVEEKDRISEYIMKDKKERNKRLTKIESKRVKNVKKERKTQQST
ncbi:hypothetical protein [Tunicatimonas pelagia]|uniref:hypothetical protein n=1 Tax=Tunicatimonas pelagia TaxID=931531 RepID=UPI0026652420|nr:hypothetical protein [Tunicatimonas pelagia]WKN43915.1 hypothetical protein P0M28_02880 [Tunicatimonas pelagia]